MTGRQNMVPTCGVGDTLSKMLKGMDLRRVII